MTGKSAAAQAEVNERNTMLAEAVTQHQLNFVQFVLFAGGLPLAAFGIVLSIWGNLNIVQVPKSGWIFAQAWLSFLLSILP